MNFSAKNTNTARIHTKTKGRLLPRRYNGIDWQIMNKIVKVCD